MSETWRVVDEGHYALIEDGGGAIVAEGIDHETAAQIVRDHQAAEQLATLKQAIRDALYDYDHGDELSVIDTLRAAVAQAGGPTAPPEPAP